MELPLRLTVHRAHHPKQQGDPIQVRAGDGVQVGRRDDEYAGWLWCWGPDGRSGWVPERYLSVHGSVAEVLRDYSAAELGVDAGDPVTVLDEESGWARVTDAAGRTGWIPAAALRG